MSKINLAKEKRDHMTGVIQEYFITQRDEELGDLSAILLLDFIVEKLAPEFYNQRVYDAQRYMAEKVEDMLEIQK